MRNNLQNTSNNLKSRILILFTSDFPYGKGETFIENEIEYLASHFEKILLISNNITDEQSRKVPGNVTLIRKNFNLTITEKLQAPLFFFNAIVFKEFLSSFKTTTPVLGKRLNYLLVSFFKAKKVSRFIKTLLEKHSYENFQLYLYSYWWLDEALGIALYKKDNPDVIAISRAHGYDLYLFRQQHNYLPLKKFTIDTLDKIYVISKNGRDYLKETYSLSDSSLSKIEVSRLGTKALSPIPISYIPQPIFTIVSCSYIYPNKRIHLIAEAILLLDNHKINWIHLGDFINWVSEEYKKKVLTLFEKINTSTHLQLSFKGNLKNEDLLNFYKNNQVDLFINVSESEGIPVSIMEAMSAGIPTLATNVGGTNEIVNDNNGYLLPSTCTAETIAAAILKHYKLAAIEKTKKRTAAFETWNLNYNAERNYNKFVTDILNL